jgi:hypothetical protein
MFAFADVQAEVYPETSVHLSCRSFVVGGRRSSIDGRHPRYDETCPLAAVFLFSGPSMPPGPVTPPPDHAFRNYEKVTG